MLRTVAVVANSGAVPGSRLAPDVNVPLFSRTIPPSCGPIHTEPSDGSQATAVIGPANGAGSWNCWTPRSEPLLGSTFALARPWSEPTHSVPSSQNDIDCTAS